jgi:hypothetical protein
MVNNMNGLAKRIDKIEKDIGRDKDRPVWVRLPDPENPGKTIEFVGCRTLADIVRSAAQIERVETK